MTNEEYERVVADVQGQDRPGDEETFLNRRLDGQLQAIETQRCIIEVLEKTIAVQGQLDVVLQEHIKRQAEIIAAREMQIAALKARLARVQAGDAE